MEKIKFNREIADDLCSIMNYEKSKTFFYADDFLKLFQLAKKENFYEAIGTAESYVRQFIKESSNYFTYVDSKKGPQLSIEGIFYALMWTQDIKNENLFNELTQQIHALLPRSAFEKRVRARELYMEENNEMASKISQRLFKNKSQTKNAIQQFNNEILLSYYGKKTEDIIKIKRIDKLTKNQNPNYLDYITAKELIDLYFIKHHANEMLQQDISLRAALLSVKDYALAKKNSYMMNNLEHPLEARAEEITVKRLSKMLKDEDYLKTFGGEIEFKNEKEKEACENFKRYLKKGALKSFDVLKFEK